MKLLKKIKEMSLKKKIIVGVSVVVITIGASIATGLYIPTSETTSKSGERVISVGFDTELVIDELVGLNLITIKANSKEDLTNRKVKELRKAQSMMQENSINLISVLDDQGKDISIPDVVYSDYQIEKIFSYENPENIFKDLTTERYK